MRTRNLLVGLIGAGVVAVVVWVVAFAVPRLTGELTGSPEASGRLPALPTMVASDLRWEGGPGTVGSWITNAAVFGNDGFIYALSTAPGLREIPNGVPAPHAVYRSQDGLVWSHELLAGLGEDLYPRDIAQAGSNLYVVGTAPSARNPTAAIVRVGSSIDAGASWESVDLEIDNSLLADVADFGSSLRIDIAASALGNLVGAGRGVWVDNVNRSEVTLFVGSPGDDFQSAPVPFAEGYSLERVDASAEMFYAIVRPSGFVGDMSLLELWRSPDGHQWDRSDNFPFLDMVTAFGEVGEYRVVVGHLEGRLVVGASIDEVTWDEIDLSELVPPAARGEQWISAAGAGPAGLYFNVQSFIPVVGRDEMHEVSQLIESADLRSWSSTATANLVQGFVEQVVVGDDFVFVNATSGLAAGRVHLIGTRG